MRCGKPKSVHVVGTVVRCGKPKSVHVMGAVVRCGKPKSVHVMGTVVRCGKPKSVRVQVNDVSSRSVASTGEIPGRFEEIATPAREAGTEAAR